MWFSKLTDYFFPYGSKDKRLIGLFFLCLFLKFMWLDLLWCMQSTFTPFSKIETYVDTILVSLILLLPLICFRAVRTTLVIFLLLDGLFVANLMYFRTYLTAIPLNSYLIAGSLVNYSGSVLDSFRSVDLFFPLSTAAGILWWRRCRTEDRQPGRERRRHPIARYLLLILLVSLIPAVCLWRQNGFRAAYEKLQDAYLHTCNIPMYTIFGSLYYDYIRDKELYTEEIGEDIGSWIDRKAACEAIAPPPPMQTKDNCIVIMVESLESWLLDTTVEGQEIMPNLNRILRDSSVIYAPHVLSQVKGGRSIDSQLLMYAGLLPVNSGSYSIKYPETCYPSLVKAFKQKHKNSRAYSLTTDKPMVWNQWVIIPALGYDSLVSKKCFIQEEPVGSRKQIGDRAFLRQCLGKIKRNEVWNDSGNTLVQCVTYSGHNPFILPDSLKKVFFSREIPDVLNRYMTMANYVDRAIGEFISALKSDRRFENTLIVIMGDHEALGMYRKELLGDPAAKNIISDKAFVPLIILNAPFNMYYGKVMGQVDVYPTLLDLLGLDGYWWKGLGESILNPGKPGFGIDSRLNIVGDTANVPQEKVNMARKAWEISDLIIRYDYWGRKSGKAED